MPDRITDLLSILHAGQHGIGIKAVGHRKDILALVVCNAKEDQRDQNDHTQGQ
jgi:hypothetical protein